MISKENDLMTTAIGNPDFSVSDLAAVGVNINNISLLDAETYKNNSVVLEYFKDSSNKFDTPSFNKAYLNLNRVYSGLADLELATKMESLLTYHRDNILVPIEKRDWGSQTDFIIINNPLKLSFGYSTLGQNTVQELSTDELALTSKVLENPNEVAKGAAPIWSDSPNDKGFFGDFFDTMVLAQWEFDADANGKPTSDPNAIVYEKGSIKLNDEGKPYYEKLEGRDIYGRKVLNRMNIITEDGSWANLNLDFFDSDDLTEKSAGATVMKNLALVGTMFIPYVGPWIAGLSIATQGAGLLATMGKMALGSDSPTLSAIEGWSLSLNRQTARSEYAQQNIWCWENMINLAGDVAGLLAEQRFIFKQVPKLFMGTEKAKHAELVKKYDDLTKLKLSELGKNGMTGIEVIKVGEELNAVKALKIQSEMDSFIKGYNKIGEVFSRTYMTALTVGDTYGEAKAAGASDVEATLLTLGYAFGEYALLKSDIGNWILPELKAEKVTNKAIVRALAGVLKEGHAVKDTFGNLLSNVPKENKKAWLKSLFNAGKRLFSENLGSGKKTLGSAIANGLGEAVEEVSEELLADFSKGAFNTLEWLTGGKTRLDSFGFSWEDGNRQFNLKDVIDRYSMSFVGGAIGGAFANTFSDFKQIKGALSLTRESALQEVVYRARNGNLDEIEKLIDKETLGNVKKSASRFITDENGNMVAAPGTEEDNQDLAIKSTIKQTLNAVKNILSANGANLDDTSFLDKQTLQDLRFHALYNTAAAGRLILEYNSLGSELVALQNKINSIYSSVVDTNKDGTESDPEKRAAGKSISEIESKLNETDKKNLEIYKLELKDVQQKIKDLVDGKRSVEFINSALFELSPFISSAFIDIFSGKFNKPVFSLFAENLYGKKYNTLSETEIKLAKEKWNNWKSTEAGELMKILSQLYLDIAKASSEVLKKHSKTYLDSNDFVRAFHLFLALQFNIGNLVEGDTSIVGDVISDSTMFVLNYFSPDTFKKLSEDLENVQNNPDLSNDLKLTEIRRIILENAPTLIESIQKAVDIFKKQGYIGTNQKNALLQSLGSIQLEYFDVFKDLTERGIDPEETEYIESFILLRPLMRQIEDLSETPLETNLNEFAISIGKEPVNLTEILNKLSEIIRVNSNSPTELTLDDQLLQDVNNAVSLLRAYKTSIIGARTDNAGINNLFGHNATLNEISLKNDEKLDLAEIDKDVADVFVLEVDNILNRLEFMEEVHMLNSGQKLSKQKRVAVNNDINIFKKLKLIVNIPRDKKLTTWEEYDTLKGIIESQELHNRVTDYSEIKTDEDLLAWEKENLVIQDAIYDFFQKNKSKLSDADALTEFLDPEIFNLFNSEQEILTEKTTSIDDNSFIWWIASRAAIKGSAFYNEFRQIINPDVEKPIAPVSTLEQAVYLNYAHLLNGNVFSTFALAYRKSLIKYYKDSSDETKLKLLVDHGYEKSMASVLAKKDFDDVILTLFHAPIYENILLTEGIPGAGKTNAVYRMMLLMVTKNPKATDLLKNVWVVHTTNKDTATKFISDNNLEHATAFNAEDFYKALCGDVDTFFGDDKIVELPEGVIEISEDRVNSTIKTIKTSTNPSLIIIDEVTHLNSVQLDTLLRHAAELGIAVLVAGDFDQSGVEKLTKVKDLNYNLMLDRRNFIRTQKLGVSMRTDNSFKTLNLAKLQAWVNSDSSATLEYTWNDTGLFGDLIHMYGDSADSVADDFREDVRKLIKTLNTDEKIGFITDNDDSVISKILNESEFKEHIEIFHGGSAQGKEGRYYIMDVNPSSDIPKKDIYTALSRASLGSILVCHSSVNLKSIASDERPISERDAAKGIKEYTKKRKELLDKLVSKGETEYIPRTAISTIAADPVPAPVTGGLSRPSTSTPSSEFVSSIEVDGKMYKKDDRLVSRDGTKRCKIKSIEKTGTDFKIEVEITHHADSSKIGKTAYIKPSHLGTHLILDESISEPPSALPAPSTPVDEELYKGLGTACSLPLVPIPFKVFDNSGKPISIKTNLIKYSGRVITLVDVNGIKVPFYISTGEGGKATVKPGRWYPIFGISERGWLNKLSESEINSYYGIEVLKNIALTLDRELGDLRDNPYIPSTDFLNDEWMDVINLDMDPVNNERPDTIARITKTINRIRYTTKPKVDSFEFGGTVYKIGTILRNGLGLEYEIIDIRKNPDGSYELEIKSNERNTTHYISSDSLGYTYLSAHLDSEDTTEPPKPEEPKEPEIIPPSRLLPAPTIETCIHEDSVVYEEDVIEEEEYQSRLDKASETPSITPLIDESVETIKVYPLLFSFNTFERGVRITNGQIDPVDQNAHNLRFDSINGLIKLDQQTGNNIRTVEEYDVIIGRLRSILLNVKDKATMIDSLKNIFNHFNLGLTDFNCTFALKSSQTLSSANKAAGKEYFGSHPGALDKGASEKIAYHYSDAENADNTSSKAIVAVISTKGRNGKDVLELPLLTINSPFTLLQLRKSDGTYIFGNLALDFLQLILNNPQKGLPWVGDMLIAKWCRNIQPREQQRLLNSSYISPAAMLSYSHMVSDSEKAKYSQIVNLIRLFCWSYNRITPILSDDWTPAGNLTNHGLGFSVKRGTLTDQNGNILLRYFSDGFDYNEESYRWMSIKELSLDPLLKISKKVYHVLDEIAGLIPGHPFVLVSDKASFSNDYDMIEYYKRYKADQLKPYNEREFLPRKVIAVYILPPSGSLAEYATNLLDFMYKLQPAKRLGNIATSYRILSTLLKDDQFKAKIQRRIPHLYNRLMSLILELDNIATNLSKLNDRLKIPEDWSAFAIGTKPMWTSGVLDGVLLHILYNINQSANRAIGLDPIYNLQLDILDEATSLLKKKIYYDIPIKPETEPVLGFYEADVDSDYGYEGKDCSIHGKIEFTMFSGNIDGLITSLLDERNPVTNDTTTRYSNGLSIVTESEVKPKYLDKVENIVREVQLKFGIDVSGYFSDLNDEQSVNTGIDRLIEEINSKDDKNYAIKFTINGTEYLLFTTNDRLTLDKKQLNIVFNNTTLSEGVYRGHVGYVDSQGRNIEGVAEFNPTTKVLTIQYESPEEPNTTLNRVASHNEEDWMKYKSLYLSILSRNEVDNIELIEIIKNCNSFLEFLEQVSLYDTCFEDLNTNSMLEAYENLMQTDEFTNNEEMKSVLLDLIDIENHYNPFKENEDNHTCGVDNIKLQF